MRRALTVAIAIGVCGPVQAQKPSAQDHLKRAKAHFDLQEYADAEAELKEAYRLDPLPQTLYALAQAQRLDGECDKAIVSYRNFVRTNPPAAQTKLAQDNIRSCEAAVKPEPKVEPNPEPKIEPKVESPEPKPEPMLEPKRDHEPQKPVTTGGSSWAGPVLVLGGVVAAGAGVYLAHKGSATIDSINSAQFYDDFVMRSKDASTANLERDLGLASVGLGAALIVAGIVTYWRHTPAKESTVVSIGPRGELVVGWGF